VEIVSEIDPSGPPRSVKTYRAVRRINLHPLELLHICAALALPEPVALNRELVLVAQVVEKSTLPLLAENGDPLVGEFCHDTGKFNEGSNRR
jgi:hypothetical protein